MKKGILKHPAAKTGLLLYVGLWLFTILGSFLLPFDPYEGEPVLENLSPSRSYLEVPIDIRIDDIKTIVSSTSFSAALLHDGTIRTWGGPEHNRKEMETALKDKQIQHLAAGNGFLFAADEDSQMYELGDVPVHQRTLDPEMQEILQRDGIRQLFAGDSFMGCVSNSGYLFYWGRTASLSLGEIPAAHQSHIVKAAVNPYHIAYLLDDGTLHMLGRKDRLSEIDTAYQNGRVSIKDFALNYSTVLVVKENNELDAWGEKSYDLPHSDSIPVKLTANRRNFHILYEDGTVLGLGLDAADDHEVTALYSGYFQTYAVHTDTLHAWGNKGFYLGSDEYGRDVLTRLVHGGFISLLIGLPTCLLSLFLSVFLGMLSGYCGGKLDHLIMRLSECISSIPFLPFVVTLSAFMMKDGTAFTRILTVMLLYGCLSWTSLARLVRTKIMSEKQRDYILYEETVGASTMRILFRHLLPSTFPILSADIAALYASTLMMEASLSFLGFGVPPLLPSWGNMLEAAQSLQTVQSYWWRWFFPALCIFLSILAVHLITEALRKESKRKE